MVTERTLVRFSESRDKTKEPERWKETHSKENGRLTEAVRVKKI